MNVYYLKTILSYKDGINKARKALEHCPYKKHFCDGKAFAGANRVNKPPCEFYINGECTNSSVVYAKSRILYGDDARNKI